MTERNDRVQVYEDEEIDLYAIYCVLKKRIWLIFGLLVAGIALAIINGFLSSPVFQSKVTIKVAVMSPAETQVLLGNLNSFIKEGNFNLLSRKLGIKNKTAEKIVAINTGKRLNSGNNYIQVTLETYEPSILPTLADSLVHFLNQNKFVATQLSLRKQNLVDIRKEIIAKLGKIETLGDIVSKQIKQGRLSSIGFDPLSVETDIIRLKQRLKDLEKEIALTKGFEISIEPVVPSSPIRPRKVRSVIVAGFVFLLVGFFVALFKEWLDQQKGARQL